MNCDVPELWSEYKQLLYHYIRKRVPDEDDAKDVLQEVLMKVYGFCSTRSGVANVKSWLYQIAHNTIMDYHKQKNKFSEFGDAFELAEEKSTAIAREVESWVDPLIRLLPPEYAQPLLLSDIQEMKQQDIAQQLGLGLSATKSRIQRARQLLKAEFLECCLIEFDEQGDITEFGIKPHCRPLLEEKRRREKKI